MTAIIPFVHNPVVVPPCKQCGAPLIMRTNPGFILPVAGWIPAQEYWACMNGCFLCTDQWTVDEYLLGWLRQR